LERDAWSRVTSEGAAEFAGWLPDGERFLSVASRDKRFVLLLARLDGREPPEVLVDGEAAMIGVAPGGRSLLFCRQPAPAQRGTWRLPLEGSGVAQPWLATPSLEANPSFSPDTRFVAYRSDDSGRREVYVAPYPGPGPRHQVSSQGGGNPLWSR